MTNFVFFSCSVQTPDANLIPGYSLRIHFASLIKNINIGETGIIFPDYVLAVVDVIFA